MLIVQISDFHVVAPGKLAYGRIDTPSMLRNAVHVVNQLKPQPALVIGSGDLVQGGSPEEYSHLKEILGDLHASFVPVMGNHDHRGNFVKAFGPEVQAGSSPYIQYVRIFAQYQVVVLDTVTEGSDDPSYCSERATWLDRVLSASTRPSLLVTHHPVFPTGIKWMDPVISDWTHFLADVVGDHRSRIIGVCSGHIHRAIHTRSFGVTASSCPSTAHQVALDFDSTDSVLSEEAPGFQIHRIESDLLTTYTASFERFLNGFDARQT